jgi:hypothetical protein
LLHSPFFHLYLSRNSLNQESTIVLDKEYTVMAGEQSRTDATNSWSDITVRFGQDDRRDQCILCCIFE